MTERRPNSEHRKHDGRTAAKKKTGSETETTSGQNGGIGFQDTKHYKIINNK